MAMLCFSNCVLLVKSIQRYPWQEVLVKPTSPLGSIESCLWPRSVQRLWLYLHRLAFSSPTQAWDGVLLLHFSTPAWMLTPILHAPPVLLLLVIVIPCSFPWSSPLHLVHPGLVNEDSCVLSPGPGSLFNPSYSVLTRPILAHPRSKHCLEFYRQPRLSGRRKRMEGGGRDEGVIVSYTVLN